MNNVLLSIVVPVYNSEKFLDDFLKSIYFQTNRSMNYELIMVNDASTDNSLKIMKEWKRFFREKMKIFNQLTNGGVSSARNIGKRNASGKFVLFADPDDYLENSLFQTIEDVAIQNEQVDLIKFKYETFIDSSLNPVKRVKYIIKLILKGRKKYSKMKTKYTRDEFLKKIQSAGYIWNSCIRNELIKDIDFVEGIIYEDLVFNSMLLKKVHNAIYVDQPLYYYRVSNSSLTSNKDFSSIHTAIKILNNLMDDNKQIDRSYYNFLYQQKNILQNLL